MNAQARAWATRAGWRLLVIALVATASTVVTPHVGAQEVGDPPCGDITVTAVDGAAGIDAAILASNACVGPQTIFVEAGVYQKSQTFETIRDDVTILGDQLAPPTFIVTVVQAGQYSNTFAVRDGAVANFEHLIFTDVGSAATFIYVKDSTVNVSDVVMNGSVPNQSESSIAGIWADASTLSVTDTQILNPDSFGIYGTAGTQLTAINVVIDGAAFSGIDVDSIDATNIRVSNSATYGLRFHAGGMIKDSFFWGNGSTGIVHSARSPDVLIENTKIGVDPDGNPGPNLHGISGFGQFTLTNVVVANSTEHGVSLSGNGGISTKFTDVEITNNGASGFSGSSVAFDFLRVSITNNGGTGFYTQWVTTTAVDTTITGNDVDCGFFNTSITDNGGNVDSDGTCGFAIPNDPPTPANDTADATLGQTITIDVLVNDTDPDGDALTITSTTSANATVAGDGLSLTYVAPADFSGETFTYEVADAQDARESASVTVSLVCPDITVSAGEGGPGFINAVSLTEACPGAQTILIEPGTYIIDTDFTIEDQLAIRGANPTNRPTLLLRTPPSGNGYVFYVDAAVGPFTMSDVNVEAATPWALAFVRAIDATFDSLRFSGGGPPLNCGASVPSTLFFDSSTSTLTNVDLVQSSCNGIDAAAASDLTVRSSLIVNAANHGVSARGVLRVSESSIADNGGSGINNTGGTAAITVVDSFIYGNNEDGISSSGGSLTVADSALGIYGSGGEFVAAGNVGAGIRATFTTVDLTGLVVANNGTGLQVANNGANTTMVDGSLFFDNSTAGVRVENSSEVVLTTTELRTNGINCLLDANATIVDSGGNTDDDGSCGTNHPPVAVLDRAAIHEDTVLILDAPGVLANDGDIDDDVITAELVSGPSNASSFDLRPDGGVAYVPQANFFGDDQFTYRVTDGSLFSEPTQFNIRVLGVNDAPEITAPAEQVVERNTLTLLAISVSDVDADDAAPFFPADDVVMVAGLEVDAGKLAVDSTVGATITHLPNGVIAIEGELAAVNAALATVTYFPMTDFLGAATVTIVAEDRGENGSGGNMSDLAEIAIDVRNPNRAPTAHDEGFTIDEDGTLNVSAPGVLNNDIEPDGDDMTASLITGPASGTLELDPDGSFTYTPPADFFGQVFFIYQALDGQVGSNDARVTITIDPINDAPTIVATPNPLTFDEDDHGTVSVTITDVDSPVDDITFSADLIDPSLASVTLGGTGLTRTVTVTGAPNRSGTTTLLVGATDGQAGGPEFIPVTIQPVNDPPTIASLDDVEVDEDDSAVVPITIDDVETAANELVVTATTNPAGIATITPNALNSGLDISTLPDATGDTDVTVTVSDGELQTSTSFTLSVTPVNDAPIGVTDSYSTNENIDIKIDAKAEGLLGNDVDIDSDVLTIESHTDPAHGTLNVEPDGTFSYEPTADFFGDDEFTYVATDGELSTGQTTVTIEVIRDNAAPIVLLGRIGSRIEAVGDVAISAAGTVDPDGDPLTFTWSDNVDSAGGSEATFPGPLDDGEYLITVEACDDSGLCATASDTLVVVNAAPRIRLSVTPPTGPFVGETTLTAKIGVFDQGVLDTHVGSIDWGDGNQRDFVPPLIGDTSLSHTYAPVDVTTTVTIRVIVTDDDGGETERTYEITLEPVPNQPPTAAFTTQGTLLSGRSALFNAGSSTDDQGIVEYRWQIGNGEVVSTPNPTINLEVPVQAIALLQRFVTLTVVDVEGLTNTTEQPVVIQHGGAIYTLRDQTVVEGQQADIIIDYLQRPRILTPAQLRFTPSMARCAQGGDLEFVGQAGQQVVNMNLPFATGITLARVEACTDLVDEEPEMFAVRLQSGFGFNVSVATGTITVENAPPFLGLTLDTPTVEVIEGDTAIISWQVLTPPTQTITLDVMSPLDDIEIGVCSGSLDYVPLSPAGRPQTTRSVNPDSTSVEVEFTTCEDLQAEATELVNIELGSGLGIAGTATVKIIDDDATATLPVVNDSQVQLIEGDTGELVFKITTPPDEVVPVWLEWASGDALAGPACAGSFNVNRGTDWSGHLFGSSTPRTANLGPNDKTVSFSIEACDLGGVETAEAAIVRLMVGTIPLAKGEILIGDFFSTFEVEANSLVLFQGDTGTVDFSTMSDRLPARPDHLSLVGEPLFATYRTADPSSCSGSLTANSGWAPSIDPEVYATTEVGACIDHDIDGAVTFELVLHAEDDAGAATYDTGSATITVLPLAGCEGQSAIPDSECAALIEFYYATGGDNWNNNTGWLTSTSPCNWLGVTCAAGHVVELAGDESGALLNNNLVGVLPDGLAALTRLRVLHLGGNALSGALPTALGTLDRLELLILTGNKLTGPIPAEYGGLAELVDAQLSHNQLVGPLPSQIGKAGVLDRLTLNNNGLSGSVPSAWREFDFANLKLNNQTSCLRADEATSAWLETLDPDWNDACPDREPPVIYGAYNKDVASPFGADEGAIGDFGVSAIDNVDGAVDVVCNPTEGSVLSLGEHKVTCTAADKAGNEASVTFVLTVTAQTFCESHDEVPLLHCEALVILYEDTDGANWSSSLGWMTSASICKWVGVTCAAGEGRITELVLYKLEGAIPSELANITTLERLALIGEAPPSGPPTESCENDDAPGPPPLRKLTGEIPSSYAQLTTLKSLALSNNSLTGTIPPAVVQLPHLEHLTLSGNQLGGLIPAPADDTELRSLTLSDNELTGFAPGWPIIPHLLSFYALGNALVGSVPSELFMSPLLERLSLNDNQLSGSLPSFFAGSSLITVDLSNNALTGGLPDWLGEQPDLKTLRLHSNQFTGQLPTSLGEYKQWLTELDLAHNAFAGVIPAGLADQPRLAYVNLSFNNLTGSLPGGWETPWLELNVEHNNLSGAIPTDLELAELRAGWNKFTSLPASMEADRLDVQSNELAGPVPPLDVLAANLSSNQLTSLPVQWFDTPEGVTPTVLDASNNQIDSLREVTSPYIVFRWLDLSNNPINGPIPTSWYEAFPSLRSLRLASAGLTGPLQGSLISSGSMQRLDLSDNDLSGEIPSELVASIQPADVLDCDEHSGGSLHLDHNAFSGFVPNEVRAITVTLRPQVGCLYAWPETAAWLDSSDPGWDDGCEPPTVAPMPDITVVVGVGDPAPVVTWLASATDPTDGPVSPVCVPGNGQRFGRGTTTVVCTATDSSGQSDTISFDVHVVEEGDDDRVTDERGRPADDFFPGGNGSASGSGFMPGGLVRAELRSTPVTLAEASADSHGRVKIAFTIPLETQPGDHHVVLVGVDAQGRPREVRFSIKVILRPAPPSISVLPAPVNTSVAPVAAAAPDTSDATESAGAAPTSLAYTGRTMNQIVVLALALFAFGSTFSGLGRVRRSQRLRPWPLPGPRRGKGRR